MRTTDLRSIIQLGPEHQVPLDQPFTRATAMAAGVADHDLTEWTRAGLLKRPVRGVYHVTQLPDTLSLRIAALKLVVPEDAVVTDRTAAWLHGAPRVLAPGDHLVVPKAHIFLPPGRRLRNTVTASGERTLAPDDVIEIDGLRVTTPLRTCWDVGRLLHRDQALAVMDAVARIAGLEPPQLLDGLPRFRGERGIVQLRQLAPLVDGRSQSPGESILRLRWLDLGLPAPQLQIAVPGPRGTCYLDLGLVVLRFSAEYDGEEFHGEDRRAEDEERRGFLSRKGGWVFVVARKCHLFGAFRDIDETLVRSYLDARSSLPRRLKHILPELASRE